MNLKIVIEEKALHEITAITKWYSEKSLVASENFEKEIKEAIEFLRNTIVEHRKVLNDTRILPLKIFPYNIYYSKKVLDNKLFIIAVLHNKRDNLFIKSRLDIR